jgi:myo-inositol-1(or 4)-monophosphatase
MTGGPATQFGQVLATAADAAAAAFGRARAGVPADELRREVGIGGDGTPTSRLDEIVDAAVIEAAEPFGVNILSEEAGWIDRGSAVTLVVDPVDGTANALAGVPLCTFSGAIVVDGRPVEALTRWLDTGRDWACRADASSHAPASASARTAQSATMQDTAHSEDTVRWRTTGRTALDGAAISLLRPQQANWAAWQVIAQRAARLRILSCSTLEGILACTGSIDAFADAGADVHRYVDLVAAQVYAHAAGAVVADAFGRPIEFTTDLTRRWSGIVAATAELAGELREVIAGGAQAVDAERAAQP